MESYLDKELLEKLQAEIIEDARKHYSEKVIDRWLNPRNFGIIENSQGYAKVGANCGDTIEMFLRIKDDKILEARFLTEGCGPTLAAGSMATELASGKSILEAFRINQKMILDHLEGMPKESEHCAQLAADTLKAALRDYLIHKREPWKRNYRSS